MEGAPRLMDLVIDYAALERNRASAMALRVLEAAIERKLGFPVSIRQVSLWASPTVFEEERQPARYVTVGTDGTQRVLAPELQALLDAPRPLSEVRTAKQMIADAKAKKRAAAVG